MLVSMRLPKFNICQGAVASNCFKSNTNSSRSDFSPEKSLV